MILDLRQARRASRSRNWRPSALSSGRRTRCCWARAKQSHTAGNLATETVVTYPFHPLHGQLAPVTGAKRHAGADHLIIRQPDGTLALLPVWMTRAEAEAFQLIAAPRLPVCALLELRELVDGLQLASSRGDSLPREGDDNGQPTTSNPGSVRTEAAGGGADAGSAGALADAGADASCRSGGGRRGSAGRARNAGGA